MTSSKLLPNVCLIACTLLHYHMCTDSPATSLAQFFRVTWNPVSRARVLILPPVKLKSQLSCCAFFSVYRMEEKREGWEEERRMERGKKWRTEEGEKGEEGTEGRTEEKKLCVNVIPSNWTVRFLSPWDFPHQRLNRYLLHQQVGSLPMSHWGSPDGKMNFIKYTKSASIF